MASCKYWTLEKGCKQECIEKYKAMGWVVEVVRCDDKECEITIHARTEEEKAKLKERE